MVVQMDLMADLMAVLMVDWLVALMAA